MTVLAGPSRKSPLQQLPANASLPWIRPDTPNHPWVCELKPNRWTARLTEWHMGHRRATENTRTFHRKEDAENFVENKRRMYEKTLVQSVRVPPPGKTSTSSSPDLQTPSPARNARLRNATPSNYGTRQSIRGGTRGLRTGLFPPIPNPAVKSPLRARRLVTDRSASMSLGGLNQTLPSSGRFSSLSPALDMSRRQLGTAQTW